MITEKECYICKKTKKIEEFYELFVSAKTSYDSYCIQCRSDLSKARHKANPNDSRDRVKRSRENTKLIKTKKIDTLT